MGFLRQISTFLDLYLSNYMYRQSISYKNKTKTIYKTPYLNKNKKQKVNGPTHSPQKQFLSINNFAQRYVHTITLF